MNIDKDSLKAGAELLEVVVDTFITPGGLAKDISFVGTIFSPEYFEKFKKSNEDLGEEILSVIENLEKEV